MMMRLLCSKSTLHRALMLSWMVACLPAASVAGVVNFSDSFENVAFDPFWGFGGGIYPPIQFGTVSLSSNQAHSGQQSAQFQSTSGGYRAVTLTHLFDELLTGQISVYLYDTAPGQYTLYSGLYIVNSHLPYGGPGSVFFVYIADWGQTFYGVGAGGGGEMMTSVPRSLGWHQFAIDVGTSGIQLLVDGIVGYSAPGDFAFDQLYLTLEGAGGVPNTTFYYDDFSLSAQGGAVPEPASWTLILAGAGLVGLRARFRTS